jgi:hypothetical protein
MRTQSSRRPSVPSPRCFKSRMPPKISCKQEGKVLSPCLRFGNPSPGQLLHSADPNAVHFQVRQLRLAGAILLTSVSPARPEDEINPFRAPDVGFSPCLGQSPHPAEASPVTNPSFGITVQ